jgi:hypothetical protein
MYFYTDTGHVALNKQEDQITYSIHYISYLKAAHFGYTTRYH